MNQPIRTFIAIEIDQNLKKILTDAQNRFKEIDCSVKWVRPENMHLTLKFLGDVPVKKIDLLKHSLKKIFFMPSFETELTELGGFPSIERPRILWAGLSDEQGYLTTLVKTLEHDLGKIGFRKDRKSFHPHLTIGRIRTPKNIDRLSKTISDYPLPSGMKQTVRTVTLYQSTLTPTGPIYEPLETYPLLQ